MKNLEGNIGEVSFGHAAELAMCDKADKEERPLSKTDRFIKLKMVENEVIPNYDGKTTYGMLFRQLKNSTTGEVMSEMSVPPEIDDVLKFKEWFSPSLDDEPETPLRKAA